MTGTGTNGLLMGLAILLGVVGLLVFTAVPGCSTAPPTGNTNDNTDMNDNSGDNTNDNQPDDNMNDNDPGDNTNDNEPDDNMNDNVEPGDSGVTGKFVGADACMTCHSGQHEDWSATLHAGAMETLEASDHVEEFCIACHSVGFGEEGGYVDRATTNSLAGVQCENCHGAGKDHVDNVGNPDFLPPSDLGSEVCGQCHTGDHHPTFEQWEESGHAHIDEGVAEDLLVGGFYTNTCGICHSGEVFIRSAINGEEVPEDAFAEATEEDLVSVSCVACHDPHQRTGLATEPDTDRDYQLRFADIVTVTPSNVVSDVTDPTRYNLCGQCHHSRGRTWEENSRAPHHSVQSNMVFGELPVPDGADALVASTGAIHHHPGFPVHPVPHVPQGLRDG
jgi:hypothetical protein